MSSNSEFQFDRSMLIRKPIDQSFQKPTKQNEGIELEAL